MTRIDFYHYAEDKLRYACRAGGQGGRARQPARRVLARTRRSSRRFDRLLWTFQSTRFVPHCRATDADRAGDAGGPRLRTTPRCRTTTCSSTSGDDWPPFFASFERLLEIVGTDEEDKQRARGRFVFYRKRGYEINVNAIGEA